jgi:hypothetical protein
MDHRDVVAATNKWYVRIDEHRMVAVVEELYDPESDEYVDEEVPIHFEVCPTCEGKGSHVNPSIDSEGLGAEDFAEDPDFEDDYRAGTYDVPCYECGGKRVAPAVDVMRCPAALLARVEAHARDLIDDARERVHEREMGY